jgi:photosystem II stability/assembly factor-like uncharacterized protein
MSVRISAFISVHLWLALCAYGAPRWNIQYFYDRADSNFAIEDLECPTSRHCVAAGWIDDKKGHGQGAVVVSSDAGQHWSQYESKERPISLFFLNEGLGWMVTDRGLWSTTEGGRAWTKIQTRKGILGAWFLDADHGYLIGLKGLAEQTADGGKTWVRLAVADKVPDPMFITYGIVTFREKHGIILGAPDPNAPSLSNAGPRSGRSTKVAVLETLDGGQKWTAGSVSMDGELAQLKISAQGSVVSLIQYNDPKIKVGSVVYKTPLGSREGAMLFAERDRMVTDFALFDDASAVVAAIEPPGDSTQLPIPGRLRMLRSDNLKIWREMDVDYRAVAQRAIIAAPDAQNIWVATDTGAILKLVE